MKPFAAFLLLSAALTMVAQSADSTQPQPPGNGTAIGPKDASVSEDLLRTAGLSADGAALVEFFRQRMRTSADMAEMLALARQLGHSDPDTRSKAAARLLAAGSWAIPALRHVVNDLDSPLAAKEARRCLEWLEGTCGAELTIAAVQMLALRRPAVAAETLLTYLPFADDQLVVDAVKASLAVIAAGPGKVDGALLAALRDPLPLRRAIAVEVLAGSGRNELLPEIRKLLANVQPRVRLRAALALVKRLDEPAVGTLIDLLEELQPDERQVAEQALRELAGEWAPAPVLAGEDDVSRKIRREVWAAWWQTMDGPALVAAFRRRTLSKEDIATVEALIDQLGDKAFAKRESAAKNLIGQGSKVVGLLREHVDSPDLEKKRRVDLCLKQIALNAAQDKLPLSAPRLLAMRDPASAPVALLAFLPFTDDRGMKDQVIGTVKSLVLPGGQAEASVLAVVNDSGPEVRIAAAEVLLATSGPKYWPAIRKLLSSGDAQWRLRVALVLVRARDRETVATLIDLLGELPRHEAGEIEDILHLLAGSAAPAEVPGEDAAARKKLREVWQAWWKQHGDMVNLAALDNAAVSSRYLTVVAEANGKVGPFIGKKGAPKGGVDSDRLVALDRKGATVWQIDNLQHPIDFQMLPGGRVLIAEYSSFRVTERDLKGNVVWEFTAPRPPISVQRLPSGNTFIVLYYTPATGGGSMLEVDRAGKIVATFDNPGGGAAKGNPLIRAACKLPDGQILCLLSSNTCVRLDSKGKEVKRFEVPLLGGAIAVVSQVPSYAGNIDVTSKGHVVVVQSDSTVAEYDLDGKRVWQANAEGNRATRLPNGNTLVASEATGTVVELNAAGKTVWQYQSPPGRQLLRARPAANDRQP